MSNNLAVKALNQYRKRDIFSYLGLRYYLENVSAREDRWIHEVSCRLVTDSSCTSYLKTLHFKGYSNETFEYRNIYIPAPNEALAETALITEISKYREFQSKPYVYSYRFSSESEKNGVFKPYFNGFKERHRDIANACQKFDGGYVLYTDIKKFYPSIVSSDAFDVWERICGISEVEPRFVNLGRKILENHKNVSISDDTGKGILIGPQFSHVIANLLLDPIDKKMNEITNGKYWRYVDDVVFVGTSTEVKNWRELLATFFRELNLELHSGEKDFLVSCKDWLKGENDFEDTLGKDWITLISDIKRFLLANPNQVKSLERAFNHHHIRIPVIDYSNAVKDPSYLRRFQDWKGKYRWARKTVVSIDIEHLLKQAKKCEIQFKFKINELLNENRPNTVYEKKRITPKLRYLAGRILYLMDAKDLIDISKKIHHFHDLFLLSKVMYAVATRDVTEVLLMGVNASHVASQLLRVVDEKVKIGHINITENSEILEQTLSVLEINGISHDFQYEMTELRLLSKAECIENLMNSDEGFIKEFACLHGALPSRHQNTLNSSFDRDENLALDVLNQLQQSSHC